MDQRIMVSKGFGLLIEGSGHQKGCVHRILYETEKEFGKIKNIFSNKDYTLVLMESEQDREKIKEILKEHEDLEVKLVRYS